MTTNNITPTIPGYIAGSWDIDPSHSEIGFTIRHMMVSKTKGKFTNFTSQLVTAKDPTKSTLTASVELNSIDTGNEKRDGHLRSTDFLAVEKNPTMTFQSTEIKLHNNEATITGNLTIKQTTKPIQLQVELGGFAPDAYGGIRSGFSATGEINRNDFDITFNMPIEKGGVVIGDKIKILIEAEFVLNK